ncbi:unnamed protein product [Cyprideis torosa]|uniref:Uncharacterized protein n=1 Tax=Cyprideis torosa TaxID=163714 RepID=A0A7R8ZPQ5_9CRUS|nr:unnamed protein product [Cyprideis torosa]CAG0894542.1 unnamed protein product [Cyprideis torosa]
MNTPAAVSVVESSFAGDSDSGILDSDSGSTTLMLVRDNLAGSSNGSEAHGRQPALSEREDWPPEPPGPDDRGAVNIITRSSKFHPDESHAVQNYPGKGSEAFTVRPGQSSTKLRDFHQREIFQ